MILVRDVFRLKFGKAREAIAAWKEITNAFDKADPGMQGRRMLADLVGPFYTLVLESTFESLAKWEEFGKSAMANEQWRKKYQEAVSLTDSGYREIFNIVN